MPTEPSLPSPTPPSRRWLRWGALPLGVLLLCMVATPHLRRWLAPAYVVTAGNATFRPDLPWGVISPSLLSVEVKCECNRRRPLCEAVLVIDSLTDDQGRDLANGPIAACGSTHAHLRAIDLTYESAGTSGFRGGSPRLWPTGMAAHRFAWHVDVPRVPRLDIRTVHLVGTLEIAEGGELGEATVRAVELRQGTRFTLAGAEAEITMIDNPNPTAGDRTIYWLRLAETAVYPERIVARAADGSEYDNAPPQHAMPVPERTGDAPVRCVGFSAPDQAARVDLTITYRRNPVRLRLPVDLTYQVRHRREGDDGDQIYSMFGADGPTRMPPADSDWGTPMPAADAPAVSVVPDNPDGMPGRLYQQFHIPLRIGTDGPREPAATDLRLDTLTDGSGTDLLRATPWRGGEFRPVALSADGSTSYRLLVWSRPPLTGSGVCRVCFGSDPTTVTIPCTLEPGPARSLVAPSLVAPSSASPPTVGAAVTVGALTLHPRRIGSDFVEFKAVGNLGIIHRFEALDAAGAVLASASPQRHPFHSRESWFYLSRIDDPARIRAWRITHFQHLDWIDRPFAFTTKGLPTESPAPAQPTPNP